VRSCGATGLTTSETSESISKVWVLDEEVLPTYTLGAVVGPSGTGKSTCLSLLVQGGPLSDGRPWHAKTGGDLPDLLRFARCFSYACA
jgi:ABC-type transporter Mla maintaining outer membrane lipid asymmetry ATPase subunit MlaF